MTSRPTAPSRPISTARLLRAVAAFGTVGALALAGLSEPATAQTDAPATAGSSAAAESKGTIKGSVKMEDGKKSYATSIEVWRKVPDGGEPKYGGMWKRAKSYLGGDPADPLAMQRKWDYAIKDLSAGKYRLIAVAGSEKYQYGPQAYKKGAMLLSGDTVKVKAGKTTKDINFKLVKTTDSITGIQIAVAGDPVVGESLTASVTGGPSGAEVHVAWYRTNSYRGVGIGESLTLTPDLAGVTLDAVAYVYKLGWYTGWDSQEVGPIGTSSG